MEHRSGNTAIGVRATVRGLAGCITFNLQAEKDAVLIASAGLKQKAMELIVVIGCNPFQNTDANGEPYKGIVKIIRMWTHYE